MDSPSFEGFHAQLNCKFTYGNKNITQLTLKQFTQFRIKKQNRAKQDKTGMMKNMANWRNC